MSKKIDIEKIVKDLKENPRPSPDFDALHKETGNEEWSGLEYNAPEFQYEEFQDNILDFGISQKDVKNVGDSEYFGRGAVPIELLHRVVEEIDDIDPEYEEGYFEVRKTTAFKLSFSCGVNLIMVKFATGILEDIDDCPNEKNLNFYCYTDDEDWHSHDPATHEHGYWDEMLWDVQESETIEDDD